MIEKFTTYHIEHVSIRSFEEVVASFEAAVGSIENYDGEVKAAKNAPEFEARMRAHEGSSGFMRFLTLDHGAWLAFFGVNAKARLYTIGNPLIARTMIQYDLGAALNVPLRLMIYEHADSKTVRLAYDLPSSLMSRLNNDEVTAAALKLDAKLGALAELATGAAAAALPTHGK